MPHKTDAEKRRSPAGAFQTYLRIGLIAAAILFQLGLLLLLNSFLQATSALLYLLLDLLAVATVFFLINKHDSSACRIAWIVVILVTPVFGLTLYLMWGHVDMNRREHGRLNRAFDAGFAHLETDGGALEAFRASHPEQAPYAVGLAASRFPLYVDTDCRYFSSGEAYFDALLADLERAETFILMEYFIVAEGVLWDRIHDVLRRKAAAGVEVRLLYDDVGCFFKIPSDFDRLLRSEGLRAAVFNPAHRFISSFYLNYRNHQKIVVIDGRVAYTGGVNLADEYINVDSRLGHWKDAGIRLQGSAVRSLSVIFFQMWAISSADGTTEDYTPYLLREPARGTSGWVQPYADGPANNPSNPALDLIRQAAGGARRRLWMTSPYLIIDQELIADFCLAARGGVDVRIVTPAVPDHWYVGLVNRHHYRHLVESGVRIFEYSPGFIHSKLLLADDRCATVGSVNLDFRSLYLHYENGVFLCDTPVIEDIRRDIEEAMAVSHEITAEDIRRYPLAQKCLGALFNLLSPLM
ncbi:MAG: cardiolipin synthase [Clostridiales bacterium]|nr:cardiolipin synthase [Clostridiales bacterium]